MTEAIVTYCSENAKPALRWVAYIDLGHDYLGIRFSGETEDEARTKASDFWEASRAEREETRARVEAGRAKAAATRAAKSTPSPATSQVETKP